MSCILVETRRGAERLRARASAAVIEAKKPTSLVAPAFTVTIAMADRGAAARVSVQTERAGMNWGRNEKLTNELLAKTGEYLGRFET